MRKTLLAAACPRAAPHARRRRCRPGGPLPLDIEPARRPALCRVRLARLRRRLERRALPGVRLAHPRGDGRRLDAAAQAARRCLVRPRRPVDRAGDRSSPSGSGYTQMDLPRHRRASRVQRTDFVPDGRRGAALRADAPLTSGRQRAGRERGRALGADERLPVGLDDAERSTASTCRTPPRRRRRRARLLASGHAGVPNAARTTRAAPRAADPTSPPAAGLRGPQDPPSSARGRSPRPRAATTARAGKGAGGQLRYAAGHPVGRQRDALVRASPARRPATAAATSELTRGAGGPGRRARRRRWRAAAGRAPHDRSTCRATGCSSRASSGASRTSPTRSRRRDDLKLRFTDEGKQYPAAEPAPLAQGPLAAAPAGPTTRGCSARTGSTPRSPPSRRASSPTIEDHLRALRDVSVVVNGDSGKVVHEVRHGRLASTTAPTRSAGNTDETAKFPSARRAGRGAGPATTAFRDELYRFAVREHALRRRAARRRRRRLAGGPRQRGAARHGRGEARQHGLHDPRAVRPGRPGRQRRATRPPRVGDAVSAAARWRRRSRRPGGSAGDTTQYADSLDDPGQRQQKILQRHWIGVTPMELELVRRTGA